MVRAGSLAITMVAVLGLAWPRGAEACRVLEIDFTPSEGLQIVVWLENAEGHFLDTLFMTEATGRYGLGNRPGIMEFNSEFLWPYGRRETVFPVWAHRRGVTYPRLVFQDGYDRDLSHAFTKSSAESFYCRPFRSDEPVRNRSIDTGTCATVAFTDKGKFSEGEHSLYPPRRDLAYQAGTDHPDVQRFRELNDLDAVSRATPPGNMPYTHAVAIPAAVPEGEFTVWVEVSKEFDQNTHYRFPSPQLQSYGDYGQAYRGQPSVLWSIPIVLDRTPRTAHVETYVGYGDPDGIDGRVRAPDETITQGKEGAGAERLLLAAAGDTMYRVRARSIPSESTLTPEPPTTMGVVSVEANLATVSFVEPADPNTGGRVKAFEVRVSMGEPMTVANADTIGRLVPVKITPQGPGTVQTISIPNLQPETRYWVAIRAQDDCLNGSAPAILELVTPRFETPEVAACFVATAAWGTPMNADVGLLRRFRDRALRQVVLGEIFVETYYTFGPALAAVIRPSPTLRQVTRGGLGPLVEWVRRLEP
jgi:hypothetical protein